MAEVTTDARTVRCAVYTRKSTDEGLEQDFNTLDAQREAGESYIASQKSEGWECPSDRYDDGGYVPSILIPEARGRDRNRQGRICPGFF
jgi:hypothetical protein